MPTETCTAKSMETTTSTLCLALVMFFFFFFNFGCIYGLFHEMEVSIRMKVTPWQLQIHFRKKYHYKIDIKKV